MEEWFLRERLHLHRILPGKKGGQYTFNNTVLVCAGCHKEIEGLNKEQLDMRKLIGQAVRSLTNEEFIEAEKLGMI
jgi:predicted metal-binding protein